MTYWNRFDSNIPNPRRFPLQYQTCSGLHRILIEEDTYLARKCQNFIQQTVAEWHHSLAMELIIRHAVWWPWPPWSTRLEKVDELQIHRHGGESAANWDCQLIKRVSQTLLLLLFSAVTCCEAKAAAKPLKKIWVCRPQQAKTLLIDVYWTLDW